MSAVIQGGGNEDGHSSNHNHEGNASNGICHFASNEAIVLNQQHVPVDGVSACSGL